MKFAMYVSHLRSFTIRFQILKPNTHEIAILLNSAIERLPTLHLIYGKDRCAILNEYQMQHLPASDRNRSQPLFSVFERKGKHLTHKRNRKKKSNLFHIVLGFTKISGKFNDLQILCRGFSNFTLKT